MSLQGSLGQKVSILNLDEDDINLYLHLGGNLWKLLYSIEWAVLDQVRLKPDSPIEQHKWIHVSRALEHLRNWVEVYERSQPDSQDPITNGVYLPTEMEIFGEPVEYPSLYEERFIDSDPSLLINVLKDVDE